MGSETTEVASGAAEKRQLRLFDDLRKRNQRRARGAQPITVPKPIPPTTDVTADGLSDPNPPG